MSRKQDKSKPFTEIRIKSVDILPLVRWFERPEGMCYQMKFITEKGLVVLSFDTVEEMVLKRRVPEDDLGLLDEGENLSL